MKKIKLTCPRCKEKLVVGAELAGKKVRCPSCTLVLDVPGLTSPCSKCGKEFSKKDLTQYEGQLLCLRCYAEELAKERQKAEEERRKREEEQREAEGERKVEPVEVREKAAEEAPPERAKPKPPMPPPPGVLAPTSPRWIPYGKSRYPMIRILAKIYEIIAWGIGGIFLLAGIMGLFNEPAYRGPAYYMYRLPQRFIPFLLAVIAFLLYMFLAEMTRFFADVGDNSREMLEELRRLRQASEPQKKVEVSGKDE